MKMKNNDSELKGVAYTSFLLDELGQFPHHYRKYFDEVEVIWKLDSNNNLKYLDTLPMAYKIYAELKGEPKTHREVIERFNIAAKINKIIMKNPQE